ncbi:MAG: hypothetical protein R2736_03950 [Solirubrobacterales bacterium]
MLSILGALTASVAVAAAIAITAPAAQAHDDHPCGAPYWHDITAWYPWGGFYRTHHGTVQRCPLVSGRIPVYEAPRRNARTIGWLVGGDSRNWFFEQWPACSLAESVPNHGHFNHWWAETVADNLQWGYVNEVFFRGGVDYEGDGALKGYTPAHPGCY